MKRILLSLLFLLVFSGQALAYPLVFKSTIDPNGYAAPILIYSNEKMNVYIPDDMINFNLFYTDYVKTGNFSFTIYLEPRTESGKQAAISSLKKQISKGSAKTLGASYPDMLGFIAESAFFNMKKNQVEINKEIYIDTEGNFIALRDGFLEITPLNEEYEGLSMVARNIAFKLEETRKNPQIANRLSYMEQAGAFN